MHRLLRWTSIALWTAGCSPRAVEPPAPERVFAAYGEITRDALWPGFAPQDIPVAIYDGSDTWRSHYELALAKPSYVMQPN